MNSRTSNTIAFSTSAEKKSQSINADDSINFEEKVAQLIEANYWYIIYHCAKNNAQPIEIANRFKIAEDAVRSAIQKHIDNPTYSFGTYLSWELKQAI